MTEARLHYELAGHRLDNGLEVVVAPDPDAPGVAVNIWVAVGSADEHTGKTGFAHLFEHLMFQGSASVAPGEHMALVEALGGTVNATTSSDRTNYFETVPRGALDLALWLEADRFATLAITEENFETQRQVVKEEKRQRYDNQPYGDLLQLLTGQHFQPEHPYGHLTIGSMQDLDEASLGDVSTFFASWYPASNLRLVLSGPLTPDEGIELTERYFGALPSAPKPHRAAMPEAKPADPNVEIVHRQVPHSLTYLSWRAPEAASRQFPALSLALAVLADGNASRLHRALVRNADITNEVHSALLPHRCASSISTILGRPSAGVSIEALNAAILAEVDRFIAEGPTEEEVARAVAQYERDWLWDLATSSGRADAINEAWLVHGDPGWINTHLAEVLAITPDDIQDAAATWLSPGSAHELHYLAEGTR